MANTAVSTRNN